MTFVWREIVRFTRAYVQKITFVQSLWRLAKLYIFEKLKTSPVRLAQLLHGRYAVIGCKLKQNANEGCNIVQVLQDLFYVLLHVLFYL